MPNSFRKEERLKSRTLISLLFKEGQSFGAYPIRAFWIEKTLPDAVPAQVSFSVPRRAFPHAVDRNRIRRQMREAYRLQKETLYKRLLPGGKQYALMLVYVAKEPATYEIIEQSTRKMIRKLLHLVNG